MDEINRDDTGEFLFDHSVQLPAKSREECVVIEKEKYQVLIAENERLREEREDFVWALCEISECTDAEEMKKIATKALENVNKG